jgi:Uma2 family endonuclease
VLVVEVESPASRRIDRFSKPALYAEADIESYWRIERTEAGPVAHLYQGASGGHYLHHRAVNPGESVLAELPYQVQVAPATWLTG